MPTTTRKRDTARDTRNQELYEALVEARAELELATADGDARRIRRAKRAIDDNEATLVTLNLPLAKNMANRFARDDDRGTLREEVEQEAILALYEAIRTWNPVKSTLANWARKAMVTPVNDVVRRTESRLSRHAWEQRQRVRTAIEKLDDTGVSDPTDNQVVEEILTATGVTVTPEVVSLIRRDRAAGTNLAIDAPIGGDAGSATLGERIDTGAGDDPADAYGEVLAKVDIFDHATFLARTNGKRIAWVVPERLLRDAIKFDEDQMVVEDYPRLLSDNEAAAPLAAAKAARDAAVAAATDHQRAADERRAQLREAANGDPVAQAQAEAQCNAEEALVPELAAVRHARWALAQINTRTGRLDKHRYPVGPRNEAVPSKGKSFGLDSAVEIGVVQIADGTDKWIVGRIMVDQTLFDPDLPGGFDPLAQTELGGSPLLYATKIADGTDGILAEADPPVEVDLVAVMLTASELFGLYDQMHNADVWKNSAAVCVDDTGEGREKLRALRNNAKSSLALIGSGQVRFRSSYDVWGDELLAPIEAQATPTPVGVDLPLFETPDPIVVEAAATPATSGPAEADNNVVQVHPDQLTLV